MEQVEIPTPITVNPADGPYISPKELLAPIYALSLVGLTFNQFETFRTLNHDRRWNTHDALYYGWVPPKTWDGTTVARSAWGNQITFDQVQAALPIISQALFSEPEWFQVEPDAGTSPKEARAVQEAMMYILKHPKDDVGTNAVSELELAIINLLLYGNGGIACEWDPVLRRPVISWVDLRDIYIDNGLSTPNIDEGRATIRRKFMSVDDLDGLRQDDRFHIPTRDQLWTIAQGRPQRAADQTKRVQEAIRGVYHSPGTSDYIPNPPDQMVEVLIYSSKDRAIWVLDQKHVLFNEPNPYGFTPFCFAPCYLVPGRFYGLSVADVQEGNQRYIEALMNGRLDQVTMELQPPRVGKRGTLMTPNQQHWRPGAYYTAEDTKDMALMQPTTSLTNVYTEIQFIQSAADKRTGINAMGQGGTPTPSNANRTLGGMQMQMGGSNSRISHLIGNIERYMIVPMLYKLHRILRFHTDYSADVPISPLQQPQEASEGQQSSAPPPNPLAAPTQAPPDDSAQSLQTVPGSAIQKRVKFTMNASSKLLTRDKLMQAIPFIQQTLVQGQVLSELHSVGKTIDFDEFSKMIQDATGISKLYTLIRPMTQQEIQAQQQQAQAQQAPMIQKAQMDGQTRTQLMQMKNESAEKIAQTPKPSAAPSPEEQQAEQQKTLMDLKAQEAKMHMDQMSQAMKIQADREAAQLKAQTDAMMNQIKMAAEKDKLRVQHQQHQMGLAQAAQQHQSDTTISQATHEQKMTQVQQQMELDKKQNDQNMKAASQTLTPQGKPGRSDRAPKQDAQQRTKAKAPK